jgi:rhamnosyltransferase
MIWNKPKVAVLLASFNGALWIEEQIKSILKQSDVIINIYVSVDLSSDYTISLIRNIQIMNPEIKILTYGNKYGGAAKNFFRLIREVDISKYQYIAFSDQDDIWFSNKLAFAISQIELNGVDAYSSDVFAIWESGKTQLIKKSYPQKKFDYLYEAAGPGCTYVITVNAMNYFKDFLIKNWDTANDIGLHDWLIYAFFRVSGFKWYISSVSLMFYRQHSNNQMGVNTGIKSYIKRFYKVKEKWYRSEVEKIAKLLDISLPTRCFIIKNIFHLRRRTRDALVLLIFVLLGFY